MIKQTILDLLKETIQKIYGETITPDVTVPTDLSHGDYTTNVAFALSKKLKKPPIDIAQEIVTKLQRYKGTEFEKIEAVKPGFINFTRSNEALIRFMKDLLSNKEKVAITGKFKKKVIVEYSSPNIAKPFTIGHLRSTIIGDAIANLLEATGHKVYRDNHIGDWGTQFGKQIYSIKAWGDEQEIENSDRPVKLLVDLYVKFHQEVEKHPEIEEEARKWFKKLEDGDLEARRLWQRCVEWSWKEFDGIYKELGVDFTENNGRGYGEAFFEDKMQPIIGELEQKGLLTDSEGAKLVFYPDDKYPPLMIIKKDGATLYSTRDLATDKFRLQHYGKEITVINEVGAEQSLYFQQLFELEQMLGWFQRYQRIHIRHGMYRFKDKKMSTRKGNMIWLEDVLDEAKKRAVYLMTGEQKGQVGWEKVASLHPKAELWKGNAPTKDQAQKNIESIAKQIGIGALKWNDLKRSPQMDIVFDWNDILNMQGNSGPYLQYTYVRTKSILEKATEQGVVSNIDNVLPNTIQPAESILLRLLTQFPDVVEAAAEQLAPHIVCTYLYELAKSFNLFYQNHRVLNAENAQKIQLRLELVRSVNIVLKKGLSLLGIAAPQKM